MLLLPDEAIINIGLEINAKVCYVNKLPMSNNGKLMDFR